MLAILNATRRLHGFVSCLDVASLRAWPEPGGRHGRGPIAFHSGRIEADASDHNIW